VFKSLKKLNIKTEGISKIFKNVNEFLKVTTSLDLNVIIFKNGVKIQKINEYFVFACLGVYL
jgi:hypothetical protein